MDAPGSAIAQLVSDRNTLAAAITPTPRRYYYNGFPVEGPREDPEQLSRAREIRRALDDRPICEAQATLIADATAGNDESFLAVTVHPVSSRKALILDPVTLKQLRQIWAKRTNAQPSIDALDEAIALAQDVVEATHASIDAVAGTLAAARHCRALGPLGLWSRSRDVDCRAGTRALRDEQGAAARLADVRTAVRR